MISLLIPLLAFAAAAALAWPAGKRLFPDKAGQPVVVAVAFGAVAALFAFGVQSALAPEHSFTGEDAPRLRTALTDGCRRWCEIEGAADGACEKVCDCAVGEIATRHAKPAEFVGWFSAMSGTDKKGYEEWMLVRGDCARRFAPELKPRASGKPSVSLPGRSREQMVPRNPAKVP